jgi:hypothetical protein
VGRLLASWAATLDREQALPTADHTAIPLPDRPEA